MEITLRENSELINKMRVEQKPFNSDANFPVLYISDIHIDAHMANEGIDIENYKNYINKTVSNLFAKDIPSAQLKRIPILIAGDIANRRDISLYFLKRIVLYLNFIQYKEWKVRNSYKKPVINEAEIQACRDYCNNIVRNLESEYECQIKSLKKWFKYNKKIHSSKSEWEMYSLPSVEKSPSFVKNRISTIKNLESEIQNAQNAIEDYIERRKHGIKYNVSYNLGNIYYVLGNHELSDFETVEQCVKWYRANCSQIGIHFLHNEYEEISVQNDFFTIGNAIICGGNAFPKYNKEFNCTNMVTSIELVNNRKKEIEESNKFFASYKEALKIATDKEYPLIVLSHHGLDEWCDKVAISSRAIYFTGHSHKNIFVSDNSKTIYGDNQIGYTDKNIIFKYATIGTLYNPFIDYVDGYYEITPLQYKAFMRYSNEKLNSTKLIERYINSKDPYKFYMIKKYGYYGFFLVRSKGSLICVGGSVRKASDICDIRYFNDCFSAIISRYIGLLAPYRAYQEKLSSELKSLDFDGTIHGCIIDIDYSHHISINPIDGKLTFYYSPSFGTVQDLGCFENTLVSIQKEQDEKTELQKELDAILKSLVKQPNVEKSISERLKLARTSKMSLLSAEKNNISVGEMQRVETSGGFYSISRKFNQLQRLFTSNVLREWDDKFAQSIVSEDSCYRLNSTQKNPYNMVRENWLNIFKINTKDINASIVRASLEERGDKNPNPTFPSQSRRKTYGIWEDNYDYSNELLEQYFEHIPRSVWEDDALFEKLRERVYITEIPYYLWNERRILKEQCLVNDFTTEMVEILKKTKEGKQWEERIKLEEKKKELERKANVKDMGCHLSYF